MTCTPPAPGRTRRSRRPVDASVLIVVMWVTIAILSVTLYFADSMGLEIRATANRVSGMAAQQAAEGAVRYVSWTLWNSVSNGILMTNAQFQCEGVAVGDARFWLIGRNHDLTYLTDPWFGLVDESSKLNLNVANSNALASLPGMSSELASAIIDWRSTNSSLPLPYTTYGYSAKHGPFETVEELRLVQGLTLLELYGEDPNLNGVLDLDENRFSSSPQAAPGLLETTTVFTREPNFHADGTTLTNVNTRAQIQSVLETSLGTTRGRQVLTQLGFTGNNNPTFQSLLGFYVASGMTSDEFEKIAPDLSTSTNSYVYGRVNINTASVEVLTALFLGLGQSEQAAASAAENLVNYRRQTPSRPTSVAWLVSALGNSNPIVTSLARRDLVTTRSFQYSGDIVALGPNGRGYHRVKLVFDLSDGFPQVIFRQDLSRLGWALGSRTRDLIAAGTLP